MRLRWTHLICLLGAVAFVGCSKDTGTVSVTGSVTLDGTPVEGATVTFSPTGEEGQAAVGITQASGEFTLNCQAGLGAKPGSYKVAISKIDPAFMEAEGLKLMGGGGAPVAAPEDTSDEVSMEESMNAAYGAAEEAGMDPTGGGGQIKVAPDLMPAKYRKADTSGFTAEIKAEGENKLPPFEMTSE